MRKETLFKMFAFVKTDDFSGVVNLDEYPARRFAEDLSFLRAYACFEVMEAKGNVVFHEDDHLERLIKSACSLNLSLNFGTGSLSVELKDYLKEAVQEVLTKNSVGDSLNLVRIYLTGGYTCDSFFPSTFPNLFIFIQPHSFLKFSESKAIKLMRINYMRELSHVKTVNYVMAQTALPYAISAKHCDDILYVREGGAEDVVLEGSTFNFFAVERNCGKVVIKTPKRDILHGVTRNIVIELAKKWHYEVEEKYISYEKALFMDELFVTSTTKLIWPVGKLGSIEWKNWPITLGLRKDFLKYRQNYYRKHNGI